MNRAHEYAGVRDNQLRAFDHIGLFTKAPRKPAEELPKLVNPYDPAQDLNARARSYLHANCSVCHVEAGGGNSQMELGFATKTERMNLTGARPQHDTFGIDNAMLVAPGDPNRSILYQRLSRRGRGQMPPLGSNLVDEKAVALFREWIQSMPPQHTLVRDWKMADLAPAIVKINSGRSFESGRRAFLDVGCGQCHRFAGDGGSVGPDLSHISQRLQPHEILEAILEPSKSIAEGYTTTEIETTSGEVFTGRIEQESEPDVVIRSLAAAEPPVTIPKKDIARRTVSKLSNMPSGIVNVLNETQILDLIAYLLADGDASHRAFRSE